MPAEPGATLRPLGSSWRERDPQQTLATARGLMPRLGISRVTDTTRMDRLGLPVYASVRPRSLTLRVNAGKGLAPVDAEVGALMEAIEYAAAEPQASAWHEERLPLGEVVQGFDGRFGLRDLAPRVGAVAAADEPVATVACEDLGRGGHVRLPAALVFVPFDGDAAARVFGWSGTGLASGNSVDEATLHALFEVLERDALALNQAVDASAWLPHEELPAPFDALAERWQALGVALAVRWVPQACGLPCFEAWLHDARGSRVDLASGSGAHLDRGIALARAICEAAQSRLSHIHGGRDDITRFYAAAADAAQRQPQQARLLARIFDTSRRVRLADVTSLAADGIADPGALTTAVTTAVSATTALQSLRARMAAAGFPSVLRHRFDIDLQGLQVVKLVVPGCEDIETDTRRMGPRLLQRVVGGVAAAPAPAMAGAGR